MGLQKLTCNHRKKKRCNITPILILEILDTLNLLQCNSGIKLQKKLQYLFYL